MKITHGVAQGFISPLVQTTSQIEKETQKCLQNGNKSRVQHVGCQRPLPLLQGGSGGVFVGVSGVKLRGTPVTVAAEKDAMFARECA